MQQLYDSNINIITLGTFDLFHYGHVNLLSKCKRLAGNGFVIVGLNTDEFVKKYKGKQPILSYNQRKKSILKTGYVDKVISNSQSSGNAKNVIINSNANLIVIGSDWATKDYVGQLGINWDWLDRQKIGICYINYTKGISSSKIKSLCKE